MGKEEEAAVGFGTSDGWEAWKVMNGKVEGGGQGVALEGVVAVGGEGDGGAETRSRGRHGIPVSEFEQ